MQVRQAAHISAFSLKSWLFVPSLDGVFPFPSLSSHLTTLSQTYFDV